MKCAAAAVLMISVAAAAQVAPVEIVGAPGAGGRAAQIEAPTEGRSIPVGMFVALAAGVSITSAAGWWAWRRWAQVEATERAFLLLSFRSGVRHTERQRLRTLADEQGMSPVAALLTGRAP